ncbi:sulfatase-like hydrolase/transferase, partial [Salmonella enterica]|nr:sulfatase-like hydrolase/transferase [Salmonella enterica]
NHFGLGASDRNGPTTYTRNGEVVTALPRDFYSSDYFAAQIIDEIGPQRTGQPFFAYLAFTAPHWPLQAPPEDIARYRGRYDAGYEAL